MLRTTSITIALTALCLMATPAAADDVPIGCFSDGDYVYLHGGITYQYFIDKGDKPVDCPPEAVKLGLELAEEAVQVSCVINPDSLCEQKKEYVALIHRNYGALLASDTAATPATVTTQATTQAAAVAPAAGTPGTIDKPSGDAPLPPVKLNARATIRWAQVSLQQLGYDPGNADGALGRRTVAAIRKYETDNHLPVTGKMSLALVDSLKQQTQKP